MRHVEHVEPGATQGGRGGTAAVGGVPDPAAAPACCERGTGDHLVEVVGDDPGVLEGTRLAVAGVDDDVCAVLGGGTELDGGGEPGAAATGETGLLQQVGDVHDHTFSRARSRWTRSAVEDCSRQATAPAPTTPHRMVVPRRIGSEPVPRAMPCTTAIGHSA